MNVEQIEKNIKDIAAAGKKLDAKVQDTALAIALHSHEHGEVSLVNKLVLAMADWKGARHKAMHAWLELYAPVMVNPDESAVKAVPYVFNPEKRAASVEDRNAIAIANGKAENHWYNQKKDSPLPESVDVMAMIQAVMKKAGKLQKDGVPLKAGHEKFLSQLEQMASAE